MKKVFSVAIIALLALSFTFTSCSKDDDETLDGTSWTYEAKNGEIRLSFTTSRFKMTLDIEDEDSTTVNGTYTYSKSTSKVILEDNEGTEVEGTVDGNKLRLDFTEYLGSKITFIKD
jgi:hypothetical protein